MCATFHLKYKTLNVLDTEKSQSVDIPSHHCSPNIGGTHMLDPRRADDNEINPDMS